MMTAQTIEKMDQARFNAWLVQTIGFALFLGILIFHFITGNQSTFLIAAEIVGVLIFLVGVFWKMIVFRKIQRDHQVRDALYNELYVQYGYKTYIWGFWAFLFGLLILNYAALPLGLTAQNVCLIGIYLGVMTQQIATLVYYRK